MLLCKDVIMLRKKNTYLFLGDEPSVTNIDDLPIVVDGRHGNWILANLRGNICLYLEAKILQHQVAWKEHTQAASLHEAFDF